MIAMGSVTLSNIIDGKDGEDGKDGVSIKSSVVEYAVGSSPTDPPGRELYTENLANPLVDEEGHQLMDWIWSTTVPTVPDGYYLWSRTTITLDNENQDTSYSYSVAKSAPVIQTERRQYYLSTSSEALSGGSWVYEQPAEIPENKYLWGRFEFLMTDGSIHYSDAVYENTLGGVINLTNAIDKKITQKIWQTDIKTRIDSYDNTIAESIRDRITSTETDLDGIHTTISDMSSKIGDSSSGLIKKVNTIEETAEEHTQKIQKDILGKEPTSVKSIATQAADHFSWLVQSGSSASELSITDNAINAIAAGINVSGLIKFSSFDTQDSDTSTFLSSLNDINVLDITIEYTYNDDPTTIPIDSAVWTPSPEPWRDGIYIWQRTLTKYKSDPEHPDSQIVCLTGQKGATGSGINTASVYLYKRYPSSTSTVAKPTGSTTYNFTEGRLYIPNNTNMNGWQQTIPSGTDPCYLMVTVAASSDNQVTISKDVWTNQTPVKFVENGARGASGLNQATVTLYKRASSAPTAPSSNLTYQFSTGKIISGDLEDWSQSIPAVDGDKACWAISAPAVGSGQNYTILSVPGTWTEPVSIIENGIGIKETHIYYGISGSGTEEPGRVLVNELGQPLKYDIDDNALLLNNVWQTEVPEVPDGLYLWTKTETIYTDDSSSVSYSAAKSGVSIASTKVLYNLSAIKPSKDPLTDMTGWSLTPQDYDSTKKYWTCTITYFKDGTMTAGEIIEDKGLNTANERALAAYNKTLTAEGILQKWTADAKLATTTIDGGFIKTHTIQTEHLATDAIMSNNYLKVNSNKFSTNGSYFDLENGNIFTPFFSVVNTAPSGSGLTQGAAFKGAVEATSLSLGSNGMFVAGTISDGDTGIEITHDGFLQASNAWIQGELLADAGRIGSWVIHEDAIYYTSKTPSAASIVLSAEGMKSNNSIAGNTNNGTGSGKANWVFTVKDKFGIESDGTLNATGVKIKGNIKATNLSLEEDAEFNGETVIDGNRVYYYSMTSGGKLTAVNAEITGKITANTGLIGGWSIKPKSTNYSARLYYGAENPASNSLVIAPEGVTLTTALCGWEPTTNDQSKTWAFTIKNRFGVTTTGDLWATNVNLSGSINASGGSIGGFTINNTYISNGPESLSDTDHDGVYISSSGIYNYKKAVNQTPAKFVKITQGVITAQGATISGAITATSGSFTGDVTVGSDTNSNKIHIDGSSTNPAIYYNIQSFDPDNTSEGFYIGSDGIVIGKGFYVDEYGNTSIKTNTTIGDQTQNGQTIVNNINIGSNTTGSGSDQRVQTSLQYGKDSLASTAAGFYLGTDGISIGENNIFKIDASGTTGAIGKIGPWQIISTAIYKGSDTMGQQNTSTQNNAYFGDNGLSISNKFKVDSGGNATVVGSITANTFYMGTNTNNLQKETQFIKAELIKDDSNAFVKIGQDGGSEYSTYISMYYGNKKWEDGSAMNNNTGKVKISAPQGLEIINKTDTIFYHHVTVSDGTDDNDEPYSLTTPNLFVHKNMYMSVKLSNSENSTIGITGDYYTETQNNQQVKIERLVVDGSLKANTIFSSGTYRAFYGTNNATVPCIETLYSISGLTGNNFVKYGSTTGKNCIAVPIDGDNIFVHLKNGSNYEWYNLQYCLEKAKNASSSGGGTSYTEGTGIDISGSTINVDTTWMSNNYVSTGALSNYVSIGNRVMQTTDYTATLERYKFYLLIIYHDSKYGAYIVRGGSGSVITLCQASGMTVTSSTTSPWQCKVTGNGGNNINYCLMKLSN